MSHHRRSCPTPWKHSFPNMGEALRVQREMRKRNKMGKTKRKLETPYRCPCGRVHFTSRPLLRAG